MKKVFRGNLYFLIIILLEIFMPYILIPVYRLIGLRDSRIVLVLNHILIFIVPAIIYVLVTKCNIKETFKFKKLPLKDTILVILLGFICIPIMNFFGLLSGFFFENNIGNFISSISNTPYLILLAIIAVMPAITEEITLRGVVLSGYDRKGRFKAALVVGLFFGIFHLDAQQFLYAAVLGFILAYVVRVTGSIYSSMIMHFIINGTSITIQKFATINSTIPVNGVEEISLKALPLSEKIILLQGGAAMLILASLLAFIIIQKLDKFGRLRGVSFVGNSKCNRVNSIEESKERIIDIPFICVIIVYLIFMILTFKG